jgi:K+/H+ antiporter YhaU regulatory subunit KhtT
MPCAGETLAHSKLRQQGVTVIAIDRQGQLIPAPGGSDLLMAGDNLIVYTRLEQLEKLTGRSMALGQSDGASPTV